MIDLESKTRLSNDSVIYSTGLKTEPYAGGWESFTICNRPDRESLIFKLKKRIRIRPGFICRRLYRLKEEDVLYSMTPVSSTLLLDPAMENMSFVLEEMKYVCLVYDV